MSFMLSHFKMVQVLENKYCSVAQFLSGLNRDPETLPQPPGMAAVMLTDAS